jgi:hypothetical protein
MIGYEAKSLLAPFRVGVKQKTFSFSLIKKFAVIIRVLKSELRWLEVTRQILHLAVSE